MNDMKAAKYTGNYADLNIYTTMMQDNLLGCGTPARLWRRVRVISAWGWGGGHSQGKKCAMHVFGPGSQR